jgi:hypothetical protein
MDRAIIPERYDSVRFEYIPTEETFMEQLIDFLNHGILPFSGRTGEVERILGFWRETFAAQELRAALVIGEAGIGKSRLIAEAAPCIVETGGTVIHVKLYPESAAAVVPLVAQELWYASDTRRLLKEEPEPTLPDVAAALRRISKLRPTLLIIEDLHLISGEALREFSTLMNVLASETLSLLCVARPVELQARAPLERFMIAEIQLAGLDVAAIGEIWRQMLRSVPEPAILHSLAELTGGNPLALRSALRNAIRNETLVHDRSTDSWHITTSPEAFDTMLRQNVGRIAEGMVSHLTDDEREAARAIATLGEVFARETAGAMTERSSEMIDILIFKGIIAPSDMAMPPLSGTASAYPLLSFTHTLLHQYLLDSSYGGAGRLVHAIARNIPLYSTRPLQAVARNIATLDAPPEELRMVVERAAHIAVHLMPGANWQMAPGILDIASSLFDAFSGRWSREEREEARARILHGRINFLARQFDNPEFHALVEQQIALTSHPRSETMAFYHLWGLRFLYASAMRSHEESLEIWERVEQLLPLFPDLATSLPYITFLRDMAQGAFKIPDIPLLRRVEARLQALLDVDGLTERQRTLAIELVATQLLQLFESEEELERRLQLLRDLPRSAFERDPTLLLRKIEILASTGRIADVFDVPADMSELYLDRSLLRSAFQFSLLRICAEAAAGADLTTIEEKVRDVERRLHERSEHMSEGAAARFFRNAAIYLSEIGALRGDLAWTKRIMVELAPDEPCYWPEVEIMLASDEGRLEEIVAGIPAQESVHAMLGTLARWRCGESIGPAEIERCAIEITSRPILAVNDLLVLHAAATLLMRSPESLPGDIEQSLARALDHALHWLAERSLGACIPPFLDRYPRLFPKKEATRWRSEARDLRKRWEMRLLPPQEEGRLRIRMIGTIAVGEPGKEPQPLRGSRVQTMLGLLVAARMLSEPLSNNEFCTIAAGGELDIALARKTANMAVVRLREAIGAEMIITGDETHELNLERVQVDLLDAHALLAEATEAIRNRAPVRAYPALLRALGLTGGEVPFPGLYDDLFEALRSDFESRLRSTLVDLARYMQRENDWESAERLLRRGFDLMPEDEEIGELLQRSLVELGRRADAERIRMRSFDAQDI